MKKIIYLFALILFLFSCTSVRKTLEVGSLNQKSFIENIPFTFDHGLPIIKVEIEGKIYNFLFDTGAPTVISSKLKTLLSLKAKVSAKTSDSQGNSNQQEFVKIPSMKIGSLNFENIGAVVIDLDKVFEFKCMNFDGIVGANQMEQAVWQIDYQNKIISATNDIKKFSIPEQAEVMGFSPHVAQKTPKVNIKIGNKTWSTTFDTGATTDFSLPYEVYKNEIESLSGVESWGSSSSGIYGANKNSITFYKKIPLLNVGGLAVSNHVIGFTEGSSALLGNTFLKNYKVVMSWKENKIYLIKESESKTSTLEGYGIGIRYVQNKPVVVKLFKGSDAEIAGIKVNDHILAVDDIDTSNLTETDACHYTFNNILLGKNNRTITILRNGEKMVVKLRRSVMLD